jgi:tRNA(Ile)-lysidine synthase
MAPRGATLTPVGNLADSVEPAVASGLSPGISVLIACSGGRDSVALAAAAVRVDLCCAIGHVDHGLRPESASEADSVRELAGRLGVRFYSRKINSLSLNEEGLEAAARAARYSALEDLAREASASAVATAHTRTDQAETLLLRLFRGTGAGAMAGIRRQRALAPDVVLLRPFLDVPRAATEAYCRAHGLPFIDDPHNADPARARTRIRALWPKLLELNPRLEEALAGAAEVFAEEDELLSALAQRGGHLHPALQRRALLLAANDAGLRPERHHLDAILRLLERGEGALDIPGGSAVVSFERPRPAHPQPAEVAIPAPGRYVWGSRILEVEGGAGGAVEVDVAEAPFPWTLRGRRPGDRYRPGGGRSKKVADLFIDAHIPKHARDDYALLADANGRVFWVEGLRPSAACRSGGVSFRLLREMKPSDGPLPSRRRHESRSATMDRRPDEEPR